MNLLKFSKHYFLCLLLFQLAACSTMRTVNVENVMQNAYAGGIDYGSLVEVKTLDRQTVKFRVSEMTDEGLGGNQGFYRYEDMKSLRVDRPASNSSDSTLSYILGALGVIALVAIAISADSVAICSPSPCPEPP